MLVHVCIKSKVCVTKKKKEEEVVKFPIDGLIWTLVCFTVTFPEDFYGLTVILGLWTFVGSGC